MTLLETLRALAPVVTKGPPMIDELKRLAGLVTPGEWEPCVYRHSGRPDTVCVKQDGKEIINWMGFDGVPLTKAQIRAMVKLICLLRNNLPTIIAALEVVDLVRDEDWLAGIIKQSDDDLLSGEPEYLARAIIAALPKESDNG